MGVYIPAGGASRYYYSAKASRAERDRGTLSSRSITEALGRAEGSAGRDNPRAGAGRTRGEVGNPHPTVKPVSLMRWLVRLLAPPGGTVLDPFLGSGTTAIACALEGVEALGIEREEDFARIARERVDHALAFPEEWSTARD